MTGPSRPGGPDRPEGRRGHQFEKRLQAASPLAQAYIDQFPYRVVPLVARSPPPPTRPSSNRHTSMGGVCNRTLSFGVPSWSEDCVSVPRKI